MPVVHIIAASLRRDGDPEAVERASRAASQLAGAPGVEACHAGRSPSHLVAAVWLADPIALEPFAASVPHMNFVMRGLAPVIEGMWSVSVTSERDPPRSDPEALWVFAVPEADGVFEWQIERQLVAVRQLPGAAWAGPTVEERERYRAGGVVLLSEGEVDAFRADLAEPNADALQLESALALTRGERAAS